MDEVEQVDLAELAAKYGTPLYVYSQTRILENYNRIYRAFKKHNDNFRLHYALKANSNLSILNLLRKAGAGIECTSPGELFLANRAGFDRTQIIYTGNFESLGDLQYASQLAGSINLDDFSSLDRIGRVGLPELLSFRVNPAFGQGKFAYITTGGVESKFGIPHEKLYDAYHQALKLGVKRFGLHVMLGSCNLDSTYFGESVRRVLALVGPILADLKIKPEYIDIGGGFGIPYTASDRELDIEAAADGVWRAFAEGVAEHRLGSPTLVIEPGRYIVGDAGWIISRITSVKESYKTFVGLDAGMETLIRPALYGAEHRVTVYGKDKPSREISICGQICESTDVLAEDIRFPDVREGDLAVIHTAGAYGYAQSCCYNGRPRAAEVMVSGSQHRLIRRRETFEDLCLYEQNLTPNEP